MSKKVIIFNTLYRVKQEFIPIRSGEVSIYACGPTVYNYAHIGNLRTYVFEDLLKRTFFRAGYSINHVMNITDVGHLQSDADEGEDKMSLAAKREARSPWDIARFYENAFFEDCKNLGILRPDKVCRATDHIQEMISFVQKLEEKGYAYTAGENVYFDTSKFGSYTDFACLPKNAGLIARVDQDPNKRNSNDFVLWFTLKGSKYPNQVMRWPSPWGEGFPGWHIECSAMASKYLGDHFDIHCGGIDHIPVHHTNEIAQSEACYGHKWVNYWMHGDFLIVDSGKMSKSTDQFLTLPKIIDEGYDPMHYRYMCLSSHYRGPLKFSYESLASAGQAYNTLCHKADEFQAQVDAEKVKPTKASRPVIEKIDAAMADDLNSPIALSLLWESIRDPSITPMDGLAILDAADSALGLGGVTLKRPQLTPEQEQLISDRNQFRKDKNWAKSDRIRYDLASQGIILKDRPEGSSWYQKK